VCFGSLIARSCQFNNNSSTQPVPGGGGAVYSTGTFIDCTFNGNSAQFRTLWFSQGLLVRCSFANNSGGSSSFQGLPVISAGGCRFDECVFLRNAAVRSMLGGASSLTNCLFAANSVSPSGAVVDWGSTGGNMSNCICWDNGTGTEAQQVTVSTGPV